MSVYNFATTIGIDGGIFTAIGITTGSSGPAYDPDAQTYFNNIVANGGTISTASKGYVNTFVIGMKSAGIWNSMVEIYPFMGNQLAAAVTKLKYVSNPYCTSFNFTNSDYNETGDGGGLVGDGSSKYLNINQPYSTSPMTSESGGYGVFKVNPANSFQSFYGTVTSSPSNLLKARSVEAGNMDSNMVNIPGAQVPNFGSSLLSIDVFSDGTLSAYENGVSVATSPGADFDYSNEDDVFLFAQNNGSVAESFSDASFIFAFESFYLGSNQLTLYNLVLALQTSLGRQP